MANLRTNNSGKKVSYEGCSTGGEEMRNSGGTSVSGVTTVSKTYCTWKTVSDMEALSAQEHITELRHKILKGITDFFIIF